MKRAAWLACIGCALTAAATMAQSREDTTAIVAAALDYGEGWYEGDASRMERALHPELAKRMIYVDARGRSRLNQQSAMTLVQSTRAGGGSRVQLDDIRSEVTVFEIFQNAAVVKVDGPQWVDYLHMAKWEGRWVIVNVLWELKPDRDSG